MQYLPLFAAIITVILTGWNAHRMAVFENQLNRMASEHKAELDKVVLEHNVRFSELHNKRVEVVRGIYIKLCWAASYFGTATCRIRFENEPADDVKFKEFWDHFVDFKNYYVENRIYFDTSICKLIDSYFKTLDNASWDHGYWLSSECDEEYKIELYKKVEEAKKILPDIQTKIERQFRQLLGVEIED